MEPDQVKGKMLPHTSGLTSFSPSAGRLIDCWEGGGGVLAISTTYKEQEQEELVYFEYITTNVNHTTRVIY